MSDRRRTVRDVNADTPQAATPPQPGSAEHWAAWLDRYGDDYATPGVVSLPRCKRVRT